MRMAVSGCGVAVTHLSVARHRNRRSRLRIELERSIALT